MVQLGQQLQVDQGSLQIRDILGLHLYLDIQLLRVNQEHRRVLWLRENHFDRDIQDILADLCSQVNQDFRFYLELRRVQLGLEQYWVFQELQRLQEDLEGQMAQQHPYIQDTQEIRLILVFLEDQKLHEDLVGQVHLEYRSNHLFQAHQELH